MACGCCADSKDSAQRSVSWDDYICWLKETSKFLFVPFIQGVMLGLGQHGARYFLSHLLRRKEPLMIASAGSNDSAKADKFAGKLSH